MKAITFPNLSEIYQLPGPVLGEPIVYAAVEVRDGARELLAARLLEALAGLAPEWTGALEWGPVSLDTNSLGRPFFRLGAKPGPSLSFSETGAVLWGAVAGQGQVGLDAAREEDLASPYPYSRAFGPVEWDWAWQHCQGRTAAAAALLWAAKEAAVKALGVGFHTLDPLDLEVALLSPAWDGLQLMVRALEEVKAWARPWEHGWLALAAA
ncbi:MAG: 4'-phosphopantetheinyl transferase superfamily protein [Syntrophobacterales bacterium]|jgi:phosphopantetheinyl transferase